MPRRTSLTSLKQISEINLTPLMDLTFILLITFIITFPLIEQGISVELPSAKADELSAEQASTITIDDKGGIYLDNISIDIETLEKRLIAMGQADENTTVMVRADESIQYGVLVKVLKVLHGAKIKKMALVTQADE
jgi:biopolymer transport protein ExbD